MYDIILFIMRVLPPLWQYGLSTLSLQAQERLTAVLHRKLKTNEDSSSKEGEKTRDSITSIAAFYVKL